MTEKIETRGRLLLIDGHHLLFQMFYGMPAKIPSRDGKDIRAAIGFVGAVLKLIKMTSPTHLAVIFDGETHNPRCELLEEYKANRPDYSELPEEENPFTALPDIYRALDYMGICHTEAVECECDDVIASYAIRYGENMQVCISSHDSDYFQLVSPSVRIIRYRGDSSVLCDEEYVRDKFGISPTHYADAKALFGDSADNIRGVSGIGPKTAAKLINTYGHIEDLLGDSNKIENKRYRELIEGHREDILRNISLIRLDSHAPLPFEKDELEYNGCSLKTMDIIRGIGL